MIVTIDLETTGLNKFEDSIIEIAMLKFDEKTFEVIETYSTLVDPEIPIPELISNITNIFDDDLKGAPKIAEIKEEIKAFVGESPVLGHNIDFDLAFLLANGIDFSKNLKLDTFFLANFLNFRLDSLNLEMLCKYYKISFPGVAHRAKHDVEATLELFKKELEYFKTLGDREKSLIQYIFSKSNDVNVKFLQDLLFPLFTTNPIDFDNFQHLILTEIGKKTKKEQIFIDTNLKCEDFELIFEKFKGFEKRENQVEMTKNIYNTLTNGKKVAIEAPTGIGKSFAYLIPAIIYSVQTGEKVYVTTKTKTLQDQLYIKDLAFLKENLDINFSYSKLKGKSNYISLKGFFDYILFGDLDYEDVPFLSKLSLWLLETEFGELDELNFYGKEYVLSKDLNSEGLSIKETKKNSYESWEFLKKAKTALDNTNITIINHSLLFSNLELEIPVLTKLDNLIIDEAHNIEDTVTDALKEDYNLRNLKDFFLWLEKIFKAKNFKKIDLITKRDELFGYLDILDDYSYSYIVDNIKEDNPYKVVRARNDYFEGISKENYISKVDNCIIDILDKIEEYDFEKEISFLESIIKIIKIFFDKNNSDKFIKILSANENMGVTHSFTLLNPGDYLKENLWDKLTSCVLTSATLSTSGNFLYIKGVLALDDFEFYSFESDFDYKKQASLFILTDTGSIKNNLEEITEFLRDFFLAVGGNILVLLTSFMVIKKIYTKSNIPLKKAGINLYAQSIGGSKIKQITLFKEDPNNSILLGTDSFWEGIDIPGEDLKYLIIHKFPFAVPSDPIFQARSIFFKDSFKEYSIPKAIIKLKQGFGRLIRTKTDKGVVILLDDRINSDWGAGFYEAFPKDINIKKGTKKQIIEVLSRG